MGKGEAGVGVCTFSPWLPDTEGRQRGIFSPAGTDAPGLAWWGYGVGSDEIKCKWIKWVMAFPHIMLKNADKIVYS